MVMSSGNSRTDDLTFQGNKLECVSQYKYLGLIISRNGNISKMEEDRIEKAQKASFAIRQAISTTSNVSIKLALNLFDRQIEPILLYGSPIWGIPNSSTIIHIKFNNMKTSDLKNKVMQVFDSIGAEGIKPITCRFLKSKGEVTVSLENIMDKIKIISKYKPGQTDLELVEYENNKTSEIDTFYNKFCKYALGITKYASNHMTLGELGRFPIMNKCIVNGLLYWWRLAHGSENPLLNYAYKTMCDENHKWLQNIKVLLYSTGLGNIWENIHNFDKTELKNKVQTHLENQFIQKHDEYVNKTENSEKCKIFNIVRMNEYCQQKYLSKIDSPQTRSIFSKLRLDVNSTFDCKVRSFRFKEAVISTCNYCTDKTQDILHILLNCNHPTIKASRNRFIESYSKYSKDFILKSDTLKIKEILNINPPCNEQEKDKAIDCIITYVKNVYSYMERNINDKK